MSGTIGSVTVGIPSWNGRAHLRRCLDALAGQRDPKVPWEIAVLDNGSTDGTAEWLERDHAAVRVHRVERNLGFAAACNRLARASDADALALLNNDTRPGGDWLRALVAVLEDAPSDVVAVAGKVVDWPGERLDFGGGVMTFDGHAFQRDNGRSLERARVSPTGSELLFATGSNMIVRRSDFLRLGGFDADYFAYFEDVDFGWRAWSAGHRILFASEATVNHRSSATSNRLGDARRGFFFERNAFLTAYKNYDADLWPRMMPAIMTTMMSRVAACLIEGAGDNHWLLEDPAVDIGSSAPLGNGLRRLLARVGSGRTMSVGPQAEASLRMLGHIFRSGSLDDRAARRERVQSLRKMSDREVFDRFPLHVVATYPGDRELFASRAFRDLLPRDVSLVYCELDEIVEQR